MPVSDLKPFTTDGCSGGMSWLWKKITGHGPPWEGLCVEHDKAYWRGGDKIHRKNADLRLAIAVAQTGYPLIGALIYHAVRIGGHPLLPLSWRWGYGRPLWRGYQGRDSL